MSKNICPCCKRESEYLNSTRKHSSFLCAGCELEIYFQLHDIMATEGLDKEQAYQYLERESLIK